MMRRVREFFVAENPCPDYPHNCDECPHRAWCYIYRQPLPDGLDGQESGKPAAS